MQSTTFTITVLIYALMGQNEHDINECDTQIPHIIKNLSSPNEVRGNNRLSALIE